jgi:hypothetical protein
MMVITVFFMFHLHTTTVPHSAANNKLDSWYLTCYFNTRLINCGSSYLYKNAAWTKSFEKALDSCRVSSTVLGASRHFWKFLGIIHMCNWPAMMLPQAGQMGDYEKERGWPASFVVRCCENIIFSA